jgi:hypothetical protein
VLAVYQFLFSLDIPRIYSPDRDYTFLSHTHTHTRTHIHTQVQYVFIHDALVELVTCGDTSVPASGLRGRIKKMVQNIPEGDVSGFTAQFRVRH